jgi:hypothetical protein
MSERPSVERRGCSAGASRESISDLGSKVPELNIYQFSMFVTAIPCFVEEEHAV